MAVDTLARMIAAGKVPVDAYEMAVAGGYTGTKEQFEEDMGNSGTNATNAAASASAAASSATDAATAATNIAPTYSSSSTYAVGDYVLYNGALYECNTAITTAEAWTAAHWTAVKVGGELTDLKNAFDSLDERVDAIEEADGLHKYKKIGFTPSGYPIWTQPYGASDAYQKDDIVQHNGKLWISLIENNVWEPGAVGTESLWREYQA